MLRNLATLSAPAKGEQREREGETSGQRDVVAGFLPGIRGARRSQEFIPSAIAHPAPGFRPSKYRREREDGINLPETAHRRREDGGSSAAAISRIRSATDFYRGSLHLRSVEKGDGAGGGFKQYRDSIRPRARARTYVHTYMHIVYAYIHATAFTLNPICLG